MNIGVGIFRGLVLCGAFMALIFLSPQIMSKHTFLNAFGLINPTPQESLSSHILPAMPWHSTSILPGTDTSFAEENQIVFSEFVVPKEEATSMIQNIVAMYPNSSTIVLVSSTEEIASSTLPVVDLTPSVAISNVATMVVTQVSPTGTVTSANTSVALISCAGVSSTPSHVVRINELAWMGTTGSFTDEWIELYNTTSSSYSLARAQLVASSSKSLFSIRFGDSDFIPPNGYFLLERTNDMSVPHLAADKIYTGALNDDEEIVELFDSECNSLDRVDFKKDFPIVSTNVDRRSMELKQDGTFGLYEGDAGAISGAFGSPKQENSYRVVEMASSTAKVVVSPTEIISTPTSIEPVAPQVDSVSSSPHIMIHEILFDGEGSDKGKEFMELYNSSDTDQNLKGWALRLLKTGATSTTSLATFGDTSTDYVIIPSHGFFLVGLNNYDAVNFNGVVADVRRSSVLPNGEEEIVVFLLDGNKVEIDHVTYTAKSIVREGQSFERNDEGIFIPQDTPIPHSSQGGS
ncbi:MAG: lamin tail domain-containing protein [Parcubacteria group bacterium]|nr:lamin tail domain-containing protein [Parcubacteria group bacterium]